MIRQYVAAAAALPLLVTAAAAADLPTAKPAPALPPPPIFTWTGFYVGGEIGGAWLNDRLTESTAFVPPLTGHQSSTLSGVTGGGLAGYNQQFNNFVLGVEGDLEATSLSKNNTCLIEDGGAGNAAPGSCFPQPGFNYAFRTQLPWQGSIRGRLGWALGQALIYAAGGLAFGEVRTSDVTGPGAFPPVGSQSFERTQVGGTIGAGVEYAVTSNLIVRAEYRYADFGTVSNNLTAGGNFWNGYTDHHRLEENSVRFAITYLFGWPSSGPVAARY